MAPPPENRGDLDRLSVALSHDLRAPIRHMGGFSAQLLHEHGDSLPPEALDMVRRISASSIRASAMLDVLVDCLRLHTRPPALLEVPLDEAITNALNQVAPRFPAGAPAWKPLGVAVLADRPTLIRCFVVLLDNAARYRPADAPVDLGGAVSGTRVHITLADGGPPMAEDRRNAIFELFSPARGAGDVPGVGGSLAWARLAMHAMAGTLEVEHREGGNTFLVELTASGG